MDKDKLEKELIEFWKDEIKLNSEPIEIKNEDLNAHNTERFINYQDDEC